MRALWILSAEQDRIDVADFIAQDNPLAVVGILAVVHTARTWPPRRV